MCPSRAGWVQRPCNREDGCCNQCEIVPFLKNLESKSKVHKKYSHNRNLENLCSFLAILFIFFVIECPWHCDCRVERASRADARQVSEQRRLRSRMRQQSRFASGPLFSDLLCCRVPLVLLRFAVFGKSVFVTFIRKRKKWAKTENLKFWIFTNFGLIHELFRRVTEKGNEKWSSNYIQTIP